MGVRIMTQGFLPSLKAGDLATVAAISSTLATAKRLADLGFVPGAEVTMVRPGAPCIVRIDGRCFGLGVAHQESIQLYPAADS